MGGGAGSNRQGHVAFRSKPSQFIGINVGEREQGRLVTQQIIGAVCSQQILHLEFTFAA